MPFLLLRGGGGVSTFIYPNFDIYHFILNLFCMQNGWLVWDWSFNAPSWCLSIEILCYIFLYILIAKNRNHKDSLFFFYLFFALIGFGVILTKIWLPLFNEQVARGVCCFFIGAALCRLYLVRKSFCYKTITYVCTVVFVFLMVCTKKYGYEIWGNIQYSLILGIFPIIIWISLNLKYVTQILENPILVSIGKRSLSMYLWHFPIQCLIKIIDIHFELSIPYSSLFFFAVYIAIVLSTAFLSYELIEKNQNKLWEKIKTLP